jgi:oligoendopeptidase F
MKKKNSLPTWDLAALYPDLETWERDFARIRPLAEQFATFRNRLGESAATLRDAIAALDDFERLGEKVYTYAHLRSDENTADSANRARVDRVTALFAELADISAWFEPEIMAIPVAAMATMLDAPELAFYRRSLLELLREREHTLSEPEERVIGLYSDVLGAADKTFDMLNDADLAFGQLADGKGGRVELTQGNYRRFLESSDRKVRRRAFEKMLGTYRKFRNTFAATLDGTVKRHAVSAKLRNYPSALASSLFEDNVPEKVYRNLIDTVHAGLPALHQYIELRRRVLKLKKIDMYDLYNPLLPECRAEYTWEEAASIARAAMKPLGENYMQVIDQAFEERWVDVPERKGKRSGAYSSGCYDSYPYLLLNFNGTLNDVFTLAHELGHSLHSYYSHASQPYHYSSYSIFVAEVASTTNEILLFEHLLSQTRDKALRAHLLCHLADEIRGTIYRQTMFAEFELNIHELAEARTPLSADLLDDAYFELNKRYHGPKLKANKLIASEWSRIPHFYYDFYVYKYATGMSAAIRLADGLLNGGAAEREAYFGFLKAGDSKDVLEIMRDAGVDLATPEPVAAALAYFARTVDRLAKELGTSR